MIQRTPIEVEEAAGLKMEELWRMHAGLLTPDGKRTPPRRIVNAVAARLLAGRDRFEYHGRAFEIPHLDALDGIDLLLVQIILEEAPERIEEPETIVGLRAAVEKARAIFWKNVRPLGLWDRLLWRFLSNPFGRTTLGETAALLGFFSDARMRRDRFSFPEPVDPVGATVKHLSTSRST